MFTIACYTCLCVGRIETSLISLYIGVACDLLFVVFDYAVCVQDFVSADAVAEVDVF